MDRKTIFEKFRLPNGNLEVESVVNYAKKCLKLNKHECELVEEWVGSSFFLFSWFI